MEEVILGIFVGGLALAIIAGTIRLEALDAKEKLSPGTWKKTKWIYLIGLLPAYFCGAMASIIWPPAGLLTVILTFAYWPVIGILLKGH